MTSLAEEHRTELTKLNDAEGGELAHFLIQSLDPSSDEDAETAWDVVLERRARPEGNLRAAERVAAPIGGSPP